MDLFLVEVADKKGTPENHIPSGLFLDLVIFYITREHCSIFYNIRYFVFPLLAKNKTL